MRYPQIVAAALLLTLTACAGTEQSANFQRVSRTPGRTWGEQIANWPEASQKAAREMGHKYGAPHEMTDSQLVWFDTGPWKRIILSREGTPHDWPSPHVDVLEQVIDFRVDPKRADEITRFDGSVIVERTKGELSARCGGEAANFLAINLARDIAAGKRSVEDARSFYEQAMASAAAGQKPEQMQRLMFAEAEGATEDRDRPASESDKAKAVAKRKAAAASQQSSKRPAP